MAKLSSRARACILAVPSLAVTMLLVCPAMAGAGSRKKSAAPEPPRVRATVQPAFTIAIEPLGFSAPAPFYLGTRNSLVSLDFLDEDHLLLTFRVPGLIHRERRDMEENTQERKVRALVLHVPDGAVQAEAVWTLHDRRRYIWMLDNGQFLLRDRDELKVGDASLQLKPFLRFPGRVLWVEMDPNRKFVVTGSSEPPASASRAGEVARPRDGGCLPGERRCEARRWGERPGAAHSRARFGQGDAGQPHTVGRSSPAEWRGVSRSPARQWEELGDQPGTF